MFARIIRALFPVPPVFIVQMKEGARAYYRI